MSERTPNMNTIRHAWVKGHPFPLTTDVEERIAEFDRWLAAHDAEVRASVVPEIGMPCAGTKPHTPHAWQMSATGWCLCAGVVAEEPEWGIANAKTPDKVWPLSEEGARETAAAEPGQWIIYSRPKTVVHEWVPVKQEGATDA